MLIKRGKKGNVKNQNQKKILDETKQEYTRCVYFFRLSALWIAFRVYSKKVSLFCVNHGLRFATLILSVKNTQEKSEKKKRQRGSDRLHGSLLVYISLTAAYR